MILAPAKNSWRISSFDATVERFIDSPTSFTEEDALKISHWELGEDARLREDARFRPTPWNRWILGSHLLANEYLYREFLDGASTELSIDVALAELTQAISRPVMFCPGDSRFICFRGKIRLAASELSDRPKLELPTELEKYVTHLPLHTLSAVADLELPTNWDHSSQEVLIKTEGWLRVTLPELSLNDRMFVAKIKGSSLDDGENSIINGVHAVFELWPSGSIRDQIVLVRGEFRDPETGSCTVKKYVGDVVNREGCHQDIRLESLNPDKERFPDLVLSHDQGVDLLVVAKLIAPLSVENFSREPKRRKKSDRRDISSPVEQKKVEERLSNSVEKFFEGSEKQLVIADAGKFAEGAWSARYVCLDSAAGGLHIEAGPLNGLPPFVKKLLVCSADQEWACVASNFRSKTWRIAVDPSEQAYIWAAPGFEDVLEDELKVLTLGGLSASSVTVYRLDAAGIGLMLSGNTLSPGQSYRLLMPPALSTVSFPQGNAIDLANNWRLIELSMPLSSDTALKNALAQCGLSVGKTTPCISWVVVPPSLYRAAPSGESYPCFRIERLPIFSIQGIESEIDGDVAVFLCGAGSMQSITLPIGDCWTVECTDLQPGNYMLEVLHSDKSIEPARLVFAVTEEESVKVDYAISANIAGIAYEISETGSIVVPSDFTLLEDENSKFLVNGPRLWPISVTWKSGKSRRININSLEIDGSLNVDEIIKLTQDIRCNCRVANLVIDFRELGRMALQFDRVTDPAELAVSLQQLVQEMAPTVDSLSGQYMLLRSLWLDKVLQLLNYRIGEFTPEELEGAPSGIAALKLFETLRSHGEVREKLRRVLLLTPVTCDLRVNSPGSARVFADALCLQHDAVEALITDGMRWFLHKRGSKLSKQIWDLHELVVEGGTFDIDEFLSNCAVGV